MKPSSHRWLLASGILATACAAAGAPPPPEAPASAAPSPPAAAETEDVDERIAALRSRARIRYQARDWRACAEAYTALAELGEPSRGDAYDGACCHARAGDAEAALTWLERAAALGLRDVEHLESDGDLLALHEHPRWPAVVAKTQVNLDAYLTTVNRELYELYQADQRDRRTDAIDWSVVSVRDRERRARALAIVAAGEARTAEDWVHAAMLMQHGEALDDYQRAHEWALKAVELDPDHGQARWLAAAAKDRWLMNQGKPQQYGTQYVMDGDTWVLYAVDPTVTDEERARWNVPPLAESRAHAKAMNER